MRKLTTILSVAVIAAVAFTGCEPENKNIAVESVTLDKATYTMVEGDEPLTLEATVLPANATNPNISWTSDNEDVATVDNGVVTALTAGMANIIVITEDSELRDTCVIEVEAATIDVIGVELNKETLTFMNAGDNETLIATIEPTDATNQNVSWTSENTSVATVVDGLVTAVADGTTNIIVTAEEDGEFADTCVVTVSWMGEVSFKTTQTWSVGEQTWSDYVMVQRARDKSDFNGGPQNTTGPWNVDCMQNPDADYGDLFSYEAVNQYQDVLCPDDWRAPSQEDFVALDQALGGTGANNQWDTILRDKYLNDWGGQFSGNNTGAQGAGAMYWSITPDGTGYFYILQFNQSSVSPMARVFANQGNALRCVK